MSGLLRSASLTHYAEVARRAGLDPYRMLSEFGLPARSLQEPELMIPIDAVRRLLEASGERSGVEAFGLLMAESRRLSNLGPLGLLIREQPTLRLALDEGVRHGKRLNEALSFTVEEIGDVVVLRQELIVGRSGAVRQSTELAIGVMFRMLRAFLGPQWRPRRVCFAHDAPADCSVHDRVFGRRVEFGHDFNGIVCARRDLEVPNPNPDADPEVARLARRMFEADPVSGEPGMINRVRDLIVKLLGTGTCTIDRVAQHVGVDRRTIHRHLAREGESFSGLVEAVRRELVERYIGDPHRSLTEVSMLLGFSTPTGFSRWYRQHFKAKPSERRSRSATK